MLPELGVVLDAGTAMYRVRDHLITPTLDIFLSHTHLDHVFGLTFLFDVLNGLTMDRVVAHGSPENIAAIKEHMLAPALFPVAPPVRFRTLEEETELADGGRLTHFPLDHPGGSTGYRIDWPDRSLAYITDTTADPEASYVNRIRGADVLLHECHFPDGFEKEADITGHSCMSPVAQVAAAAEVGRLILVHINPLMDESLCAKLDDAKTIFPNVEIAHDGMTVEF